MKNWNTGSFIEDGFPNIISTLISDLEDRGKFHFPNLRASPKIYLFSDYSESKNFYSYSFLIIDEESFEFFGSIQRDFWERFSLGKNRIIEYKKLNDRIRLKALPSFLNLCNDLNGTVLTFIISKRIKTVYHDEIPHKLKEQMSSWRAKKVIEKVLRFRELILLILSGLTASGQNILWITDNDDFVANQIQQEVANNIVSDILNKHLGFSINSFDLITLNKDISDKIYEKLCSVPDLVAGATVDYIEDYYQKDMIPKTEEQKPPIPHEKNKIYPIINWFLNENENLKKNTILIDIGSPGSFVLSGLRFPIINI